MCHRVSALCQNAIHALATAAVGQDVALWKRLASMSTDLDPPYLRQALYCLNRVSSSLSRAGAHRSCRRSSYMPSMQMLFSSMLNGLLKHLVAAGSCITCPGEYILAVHVGPLISLSGLCLSRCGACAGDHPRQRRHGCKMGSGPAVVAGE